MKSKARTIAYAAISVGLSIMFLILGFYVQRIMITCNFIAAVILFIPLGAKKYVRAILSYIVSSLIIFFTTSVTYNINYIVFFGLYSILKYFLDCVFIFYLKKRAIDWDKNKYIVYVLLYIVKIAYFNLVFFIFYKLASLLLELNESGKIVWQYWNMCLVFNIMFILYDILLSQVKLILDMYVIKRLRRREEDE